MIQLKGVSKSYEEKLVLHPTTLTIARGEMLFLMGHSGAGKTTLLKLIGLLERPSSGDIYFGQTKITGLGPRQIPLYRRQVGFIFQDPKLIADKTIFENVALPLHINGCPDRDIERRVRAALSKVNLVNKEHHFPSQLSGGEQQRVGIARAIVHKPPILIADEPTGNLDPELSKDIFKLFTIFNQLGMTIIIASHDQALIHQYASRKLILNQGKLSTACPQMPMDTLREKDTEEVIL